MKHDGQHCWMNVVCISQVIVWSMLWLTPWVGAQQMNYETSPGEYKRRPSERVYIVGKIVNIAHELQHRAGGAYAQDSLFSKGRQGLKTSAGTIWTFVDNVKGQDLQWNKEYLDKFVKIHGWVFYDAQYVEVDSFTIGGEEYVWSPATNIFEPVGTRTQ